MVQNHTEYNDGFNCHVTCLQAVQASGTDHVTNLSSRSIIITLASSFILLMTFQFMRRRIDIVEYGFLNKQIKSLFKIVLNLNTY